MVKGSTVLLVGGAAAVAYFAFTKQGQDMVSSLFGGSSGLGGIGGGGAGGSGDSSLGTGSGYGYGYGTPSNQPNQNQGVNQPVLGQPTTNQPTQQTIQNIQPYQEGYIQNQPVQQFQSMSAADSVNQQITARAADINRQYGAELVTISQGAGYAGGTGSFININPEIAKNLTATQRQSILDNSFRDIIYATGGNGGYTPREGGLFFRTGTPSSNVNNLSSSPVQYQSVAPPSSIPTPSLQVQSPVIFNQSGTPIASSASGQTVYRSQAPVAPQTAQQPVTQPSSGISLNNILGVMFGSPLPATTQVAQAVVPQAPQQFMSYANQSNRSSSSSMMSSYSNNPVQNASSASSSSSRTATSLSPSSGSSISSMSPSVSSNPYSNISQNLTATQRSILSRGGITV